MKFSNLREVKEKLAMSDEERRAKRRRERRWSE